MTRSKPSVSLNGIQGNTLPELKMLLENWKWLMEGLGKRWGDVKHGTERDVPWWYNERTSVGFLAGAIWHSHGEAVEEYVAKKRYRTGRGRKMRSGRGDLMFTLNPACPNEDWFVAEAKHEEVDIRNESISRISALLKQARQDSVCSPNYSQAKRIGLVFIAPYKAVKKKYDKPTVAEIRKWVSRILTLKNRTKLIMAWTFPAQTRNFSWYSRSNRKYYFYPGAALLIQQPRSGQK
jgi:hypothetical protein